MNTFSGFFRFLASVHRSLRGGEVLPPPRQLELFRKSPGE
jgi:hypothetical protein